LPTARRPRASTSTSASTSPASSSSSTCDMVTWMVPYGTPICTALLAASFARRPSPSRHRLHRLRPPSSRLTLLGLISRCA
jgi:hypothetical protein